MEIWVATLGSRKTLQRCIGVLGFSALLAAHVSQATVFYIHPTAQPVETLFKSSVESY